MKAVLSFRMRVPPAEPITWKLGLFLTKNDKGKTSHKFVLQLVGRVLNRTFHVVYSLPFQSVKDFVLYSKQPSSNPNNLYMPHRLFSPHPFSCKWQQRLWFDCLCPATDDNVQTEQNLFCEINKHKRKHMLKNNKRQWKYHQHMLIINDAIRVGPLK